MIPKVIHCCWLSGEPFPELVQKCMDSWRRILPDYEIIVWDSERIKEISSTWMDSAIEVKKWAFAADYIRIYALYNYGGIYLDLDVEVLKSFEDLLEKPFFMGRETARPVIEAAVMGSEPKQAWLKSCLKFYENRRFEIEKINKPDVAIPFILQNVLSEENLESEIYESEYFSPLNNLTGKINVTSNTYCIHHFNGAWFTDYQRKYFEIRRSYSKKYGSFIGFIAASCFALKNKIVRAYA